MTSSPLVSVIVPVFNPPIDRLQASLESVLWQGRAPLELICVDDGSDCCVSEWLDDFAKQNVGVRVCHQTHAGVSCARNAGTRLATGKYIMYVDSDDLLASGAIDQGVRLLESYAADVVFGFVEWRWSFGDERPSPVGDDGAVEVSVDEMIRYHLSGGTSSTYLCRQRNVLDVKIGPVARLVRRELAVRTAFPEGVAISEDTLWNVRLLLMCRRIVVSQSIWYWYCKTAGSATTVFRPNSAEETRACLIELLRILGLERAKAHADSYLARVAGEMNRTARNYSRPDSDVGTLDGMRRMRKLYAALGREGVLLGRSRGGLKTEAKLLLCRTGLNVPLFKLLTRTINRRGVS